MARSAIAPAGFDDQAIAALIRRLQGDPGGNIKAFAGPQPMVGRGGTGGGGTSDGWGGGYAYTPPSAPAPSGPPLLGPGPGGSGYPGSTYTGPGYDQSGGLPGLQPNFTYNPWGGGAFENSSDVPTVNAISFLSWLLRGGGQGTQFDPMGDPRLLSMLEQDATRRFGALQRQGDLRRSLDPNLDPSQRAFLAEQGQNQMLGGAQDFLGRSRMALAGKNQDYISGLLSMLSGSQLGANQQYLMAQLQQRGQRQPQWWEQLIGPAAQGAGAYFGAG